MKQRYYLFLPIIILLLSLFYISCNDFFEPPTDNKLRHTGESFTAKEAQRFFEKHATDLQPLSFSREPKTRTLDGSSPVELIPDWSNVTTESNSMITAHIVPLGSLSMIEYFATVYKDDKTFGYYPWADRRLMVSKHKDGDVEMFVITIAPEIDGTDQDVNDMIDDFHFLGGGSFTGKVFLSTLEGHFIRGYGYTNGVNNGRLTTRLIGEEHEDGCSHEEHKLKVLMRISIGEGEVFMSRAGTRENHPGLCEHNALMDTCKLCKNTLPKITITACPYCGAEEGCRCPLCSKCLRKFQECICRCPGCDELLSNCICICYKCFNKLKDCLCKLFEEEDTIKTGGKWTGSSGGGSGSNAETAKSIFKNSELSEDQWEEIEELMDRIIANCLGENLYNG